MWWWKRSKAPVADDLVVKLRQARLASRRPSPDSKPSAEDDLAEALQRFRQKIDAQLKHRSSPELETAQKILERAKTIVEKSGLGRALAPTLVEEVKYWPSWSTMPDFRKYVHFDATEVKGKHETGDNRKSLTAVEFEFRDRRYQVVIRDDGYGYESTVSYGLAEFWTDGQCVFAVDIEQEGSDDYPMWSWNGVKVFIAGDWMKDLLVIAAQIEAFRNRDSQSTLEQDVLERARNIRMPD